MNLKKLSLLGGSAVVAATLGVGLLTTTATGQSPAFGDETSVAYAQSLWSVLEADRLVGADPIHTSFYAGVEPHGFVLETIFSRATVDGHTGDVIVKRNYGPEGADPEEVSNDPAAHLAAVTIMYRREAGYDADNADWFWAKYLADGTLDKNPAGMQLAGRVAKGADQGCIACHSAAPGEDYIFTTDRAAMMQ